MWGGVQLTVDSLFFLRGGEATDKSITFDEANTAYDQSLSQGGFEICSNFYGPNALVIRAAQGIFSS